MGIIPKTVNCLCFGMNTGFDHVYLCPSKKGQGKNLKKKTTTITNNPVVQGVSSFSSSVKSGIMIAVGLT